MYKLLPNVVLAMVFAATSIFAQENTNKTWYKSTDGSGYISIEKVAENKITTVVNSEFNRRSDFEVTTTYAVGDFMNATEIKFNGIVDNNMGVVYNGQKAKVAEDGASYWSFLGDFKKDITNDEEVNQYLRPQHRSMVKYPANTIPSFSLWAVIPTLEFEEGNTIEFNLLDETKLYLKKKQTISYMGKADTEVAGEVVSLHKFVHEGKRTKPAYYWVNDDRQLVKMLIDDEYGFEMSTETEALGRSLANIEED